MKHNNCQFSVFANDGFLQEHVKNGITYIAAPKNTPYRLCIDIQRGGRHEVVMSVDGLDVISGKDASVSNPGYVISPFTSQFIQGFRMSNSEVAEFTFGEPSDSYASSKGKPNNVGVIGCVVFAEKVSVPRISVPLIRGQQTNSRRGMGVTLGEEDGAYYDAVYTSANCFGSTGGGVKADVGTVFGQKVQDNVGTTTFSRGVEVARFVIRYASREALIKSGVIIPVVAGPNPFPADSEFCSPPAGWQG